ncbi:MAG TPA: hypothetical protein C5S50_00770 [Methanosarcinaceae archaeon]|nr:hypothetical protein [Methanosarcinaceae archaeon]
MINNINSLKISYPWLWEDNLDMIVHNDFDGLLSAYLLHHFNNWNIIGFYDLKNIWYSKHKNIDDLHNAIWVDLDISKPYVRSIGHHILKLNNNQQAPYLKHSLNPNLIRNVTQLNFGTKYPMGTCHLIIALNDIKIKNNGLSKYLFWHPDSSWINGQNHRFFKNVNYWINSFLQIPLLGRAPELLNRYSECQ